MSIEKAKKNNFFECFARIKSETDILNMTQLAELVNVSQSTVSKQNIKKEFPAEWAYSIGKKYNLLTEWIMEGVGPKRLSSKDHEELNLNLLKEIENWVEDEKKIEPKFSDWFEVEFKQKFPKFAEWKRKADKDRENNISQQANVA